MNNEYFFSVRVVIKDGSDCTLTVVAATEDIARWKASERIESTMRLEVHKTEIVGVGDVPAPSDRRAAA